MAQAVANHIDKEHFLVLWEALEVIQVFNMTWQFSQFMMYTHLQPIVVYVHRQLSVVEVLGIMETKGERAEEAAEQLERLLFILHTLVSYRDGAKITKPESICQVFARRALLYLPLNWQWCKASRDIFGYNRCRKNKMVYHSPLLVLASFFLYLLHADNVAADTEFNSVVLLLPSAPPDHLLSAPWGECHPA